MKRTRKLFLKILMIPFFLFIASLACTSSGKLVTINISETNLNLLVGGPVLKLNGTQTQFSVESLKIFDEFIRINGEIIDEQSNTFPGYVNLNISVADGEIFAEVIGYEFPGTTIVPGWLTTLENQIESSIQNAASQGKAAVTFEEIVYQTGAIQIRFRLPVIPTYTLS